MIDLEKIEALAKAIAERYDWVDKAWAFEHFGSEMEAEFVEAASPAAVLALIAEVRALREAQIADDVRVERYLMRDGFEVIRVAQRAGADKWKVLNGGYCLTKAGDWEWEPIPSSRTDDFIERCRFDTAQEAIDAARGAK